MSQNFIANTSFEVLSLRDEDSKILKKNDKGLLAKMKNILVSSTSVMSQGNQVPQQIRNFENKQRNPSAGKCILTTFRQHKTVIARYKQ
jgi:hypothetical protein